MPQMTLPLALDTYASARPYPVRERPALSFKGERLRRGRHRIHPYPAMLHPLLVDHLLDRCAKADAVIFDPFCGSGVTLLQAALKGHRSIGLDINPLALTIARAKTARYARDLLLAEYTALKAKILNGKTGSAADIPPIRNLDYWYKDDVIQDLARLRGILKNNAYAYLDFFLAVFAFVCRDQSLTRKGEFKRYRIKEKSMGKAQNRVFATFLSHAREMIDVFTKGASPLASSQPLRANAEDAFPKQLEYDLVISSPPYGDSRTTVAYGQFSSFGLDWLQGLGAAESKIEKINVDSVGLGKASPLNAELRNFSTLSELLDRISRQDSKRAQDVLHFFNGYYSALRNTVGQLRAGGTVCLIVGNRRVKGMQVPLDQITASFLTSLGLQFETILARTIHNKIMPARNSPSNVAGETSATMAQEAIVIFNKQFTHRRA